MLVHETLSHLAGVHFNLACCIFDRNCAVVIIIGRLNDALAGDAIVALLSILQLFLAALRATLDEVGHDVNYFADNTTSAKKGSFGVPLFGVQHWCNIAILMYKSSTKVVMYLQIYLSPLFFLDVPQVVPLMVHQKKQRGTSDVLVVHLSQFGGATSGTSHAENGTSKVLAVVPP